MLCPFGKFFRTLPGAVRLSVVGDMQAGLSPNGSVNQPCRTQAHSLRGG